MKKILSIVTFTILLTGTFTFSGCARGEDDPFFTFHTRDGRLTQEWKLVSFNGTRVETVDGVETNVEYTYDGTNLYTTINGVTNSVAYTFSMEINKGGEVFSQEIQTTIDNGDPVTQSSKTSFWYWGDDERNKTAVYLELTGIFNDVIVFDIPRLAWNDMTLEVKYSDNTTPGDAPASSLNLDYTLDFDVIVPE